MHLKWPQRQCMRERRDTWLTKKVASVAQMSNKSTYNMSMQQGRYCSATTSTSSKRPHTACVHTSWTGIIDREWALHNTQYCNKKLVKSTPTHCTVVHWYKHAQVGNRWLENALTLAQLQSTATREWNRSSCCTLSSRTYKAHCMQAHD